MGSVVSLTRTGWWPEPSEDFPGQRVEDDAQGRARWRLDSNGYLLVHDPLHPLASPRHGTVLEHRMVVYDAGIDPTGMLDASDDGVRLTIAAAMVASNLAVAEALHGVVYTANANAV